MPQFSQPNGLGATPRIGNGFAAQTFRGFQVNNDIGSVGDIAQIDARGFIAEAQSAGTIGEGIASLGESASKVYQAQMQAIGRRKEIEAESMMVTASEDIAGKLAAEKDETKWEAIAIKEADEHGKMWLTKDLSPDARDAIEMRHVAWKAGIATEARRSSRLRSFNLLGETLNFKKAQALEANDFGTARAVVGEMQGHGIIHEGSAGMEMMKIGKAEKASGMERNKIDANGAILAGDVAAARSIIATSPHFDDNERKAQLQEVDYKFAVEETNKQIDTLARTNPAKLQAMLLDPKAFPALDVNGRAKANDVAIQARETVAGNAVVEATRAIDLLKINGGIEKATLETLAVDMSQATPWHKAVIAGKLEAAKHGTDGAIDSAYQSLYASAADYKPAQDRNGVQAARLSTLAATLPKAYADKINDKLDGVMKGAQGFDTGPGLMTLNAAVKKQQVFGSAEVALKDAATGEALLKKEPTRYRRVGMMNDWVFDNEAQPGQVPDYYKEKPVEAGEAFTKDTITDKFEADRIDKLHARIADEFERRAKEGEFKTEEAANDWMAKAIAKAGGKPMKAASAPSAPAGPSNALMGSGGFDAAAKDREIFNGK
jgi:hypothetical protein